MYICHLEDNILWTLVSGVTWLPHTNTPTTRDHKMASKRLARKANTKSELNSPEDVSNAFQEIMRHTHPKGSQEDEEILKILIIELNTLRNQNPQDSCSFGLVISLIVFRIIPIVAVLCLISPFAYLFLTSAPCVISLGPLGEMICNPIMDCGSCANLTEITRLSNLSAFDFVFHYHMKNIPIVVTDATQGWSAMNVITYDYLKNLYIENPEALDYDVGTGQFFKYSSSLNGLEELFNLTDQSPKKWYIGW